MDVPTDAIIEFLWNRDANPAWSLTVPHESSAWRGTPAQIEIAKQNFFRQIGNTDAGYAQGVSFELINVDIDNDGRPEPLVRFNYYHDGKLLLVLTPDGSEIDHHKSELVLRHPEWGAKSSPAFRKQDSDTRLRPIEDALHDAIYDVFSYDGKHYFDLWWLEDPARTRTERPTDSHWRLSVFQASGGRTTRLCRLRFES